MDTLYGKASEDSDESMADADEEVAPEADQLSAGSSEEISIIQGIEIIPVLYFKIQSFKFDHEWDVKDLFRELSQHLPHSTVRVLFYFVTV